MGGEAAGVVGHKLAFKSKAIGMFAPSAKVALAISEAALLHESYPSSRLTLTLQQLSFLEYDGLAFAFTQFMHKLQAESQGISIERFCHI